MSLDPFRISIWKEYFCRFDENKKDCMSHQLEQAQLKDIKDVCIIKHKEAIENEIQQLLQKLKENQIKINKIRNIQLQENNTDDLEVKMVAKNGSVVLEREDLEVIANV